MDSNYLIETKRCILQPLSKNDINEAVALFINHGVRKHLGGVIQIDAAIEKLNKWITAGDSLYLSVRLKNSGEFAGIIDISTYHESMNKELSYQFLPSMWGMGYAYEAIHSVIEYCSNVLDIKYLVSETQTENIRSCRLLQKLRFRLKDKIRRFGTEQSIYVLNLNEMR
ncbi:GNAT family N-acetyltransferase [Tissierella creatinophila]|uniref:N-acetyltransferase domain-containing protein n=1 Tax=Tissierella creatinophila DSM 6911 TaxID=1123403 RepID=A0A1U7M8C6_TISCR|nr:GNAT family N-acetyltransferase [Tissierella creatinophila]OLS03531.1 hypothetical protein TICRE_03880 [Tissierella creatinophila DSM 6911]